MSYLDNMCDFNYDTLWGICNKYAFPVMRAEVNLQKIVVPPLFKSGSTASIPTQKPSLFRDPPAVLALKTSSAYDLWIWEQPLQRNMDMGNCLILESFNQPLLFLMWNQMLMRIIMRHFLLCSL